MSGPVMFRATDDERPEFARFGKRLWDARLAALGRSAWPKKPSCRMRRSSSSKRCALVRRCKRLQPSSAFPSLALASMTRRRFAGGTGSDTESATSDCYS